MTFWDTVLWLAFATALAAAATQAWTVLREPAMAAWSRRLAWASLGLAGAAFLWLLILFIAADVTVGYVFLYTATDVPLAYRIAGTWTGREGSLLLWAVFTAGTAAVITHLDGRRGKEDDDTRIGRAWTRLILLGVSAVFLLAVARQGTFTPTDPFFLQGRPDGNGINPTLRNPYILIHPPMMFLAYGLTTVPLAASLAHMITGTARWSRIAATGSRLDWLLYTFAMGLGGLWAYYTLGFGGYWAWDPVEVANFLPWLALTVYLHAQLRHQRDGGFAAMGPLLGVLPFILTIFSTVSTRSGLWVSVHAFTDPTNTFDPDAASRLLGILDVDASLLPYFGLLLAALLASLALWCRREAIETGALPRASRVLAGVLAAAATWAALSPTTFLGATFEAATIVTGGRTGLGALGLLIAAGFAGAAPLLAAPEEETKRSRTRLGIPTLLFASVLLLGLSLVVALLFHMATVNGWDRAFWETRVPWITTPIALALVVLLLRTQRGVRTSLSIAAASLLVAVAGYLLSPRPLGTYALILAVTVLVAGTDKWMHVTTRGDTRARIASGLLALAALLDVLFWLNPPTVVLPGLTWEPRWPAHIPFAAAAVVAFIGAHKVAVGAEKRTWPYLLAGALGGYYLAAPLALAAWLMHRRNGVPAARWTMKRLRPVGVYGVHFAVGLLFVGYAASTYFVDDLRTELAVGEAGQLGPYDLRLDGAHLEPEPGTPWAERIEPRFTLTNGDVATGNGILYWEDTTGSHYPLPHTMRLWHRDIYLSIEGVCTTETCTGNWTDAYAPAGRIGWTEEVTAVKVQALSLPGVSLVWGSLALFVLYAVPIVWPASRGKDLAKSP